MKTELGVSPKLGYAIMLNIKVFTSSPELMIQGTYGGTLHWSTGFVIDFRWKFSSEGIRLILSYKRADLDGTLIQVSQEIEARGLPSNLGRGKILYFVCPFTSRLSRALFLAFDSKYFRHRKAYRGLNYKTQKRSKRQRVLYRYYDLEEQIDRLESINCRKVYRGRRTKLAQRIMYLKRVRQEYQERKMLMFYAYINRKILR